MLQSFDTLGLPTRVTNTRTKEPSVVDPQQQLWKEKLSDGQVSLRRRFTPARATDLQKLKVFEQAASEESDWSSVFRPWVMHKPTRDLV